ncbi:unnamed protein product [Didymodactylos carnosus]|uniref:Uncharacterized protein n=1 Tax=Didymodactylos carnosus TaxID=1234261 RepID=A0A815J971_9BILA|nr:unnamed protein product [Didymodactylos carnosus]CAF4266815.1 unnamed protein product [Didymodactylos carnosus]
MVEAKNQQEIVCATIESVFAEVQRVGPHLLQLYDELNTFLGSLGLYKAAGGATYDRSLINQLYNTLRYIGRQTVTNSNNIENPSLNIGGPGHPDELINGIRSDMHGDGFFSRFLISAPKPSIPYIEEIKNIESSIPSITHLLYTIYVFHADAVGDGIIYMYSTKALQIMKEKFNHFTDVVNEALEYDAFITTVYSKAKVQVQRLAGGDPCG